MTIRSSTLARYGEKYVTPLQGSDNTANALHKLHDIGYPASRSYLVITISDGRYLVASFARFERTLWEVARLIGLDAVLAQPLEYLPLPVADRVVPVSTEESGRAIVDWVAVRPHSAIVIIDRSGPVGLFVNHDRGKTEGVMHRMEELGGSLLDFAKDPRTYAPRTPPPTCPNCHAVGFYTFDPGEKKYRCDKCGVEVKLS